RGPLFRKEGDLIGARFSIFENFDAFPPPGLLAIVDLPEIKNLPLNDPPAANPLVLDDVPIVVLLAIFEPAIALQEHDGDPFYIKNRACEEGGSILQDILESHTAQPCGLQRRDRPKKSVFAVQWVKSG